MSSRETELRDYVAVLVGVGLLYYLLRLEVRRTKAIERAEDDISSVRARLAAHFPLAHEDESGFKPAIPALTGGVGDE